MQVTQTDATRKMSSSRKKSVSQTVGKILFFLANAAVSSSCSLLSSLPSPSLPSLLRAAVIHLDKCRFIYLEQD